ncbi:RDD family protein [Yinghuangia soli]|uniref:RDD family protein n=1 Tax=Yinghuangia soli TaxID=2908204 RepID=A0AA41U3Y5_9ACTN|nr:RDD family protein [Yinghuangia soli]MCF2532306.1 RDD family protein [Yinghuangia soli]
MGERARRGRRYGKIWAMSSNSSIPAAGWYPDPEYPGYVRYWDGSAWVPDSSRPAGEFDGPGQGAAGAEDAAAYADADQAHDSGRQSQGRVIQGEVIAAQSVPLDRLPPDPGPAAAGAPNAQPHASSAGTATAADPFPAAGRAAAESGAPAWGAATRTTVEPFIPPPRNDLFAIAQLRPAPLPRRLLARIADLLIPLAVGVAVAIVMVPPALDHLREKVNRIRYEGRTETVWLLDAETALAGGAVAGSVLVAMFLYEALPTWRWGRSLGKTLFGLKVVDIDSHDTPTFRQTATRWLVFGVPGMLLVGLVGVVRGAFDRPWRQGWHDKASRTFVGCD